MTERPDRGLRPVGDGLSGILTRLGLPAELDLGTMIEEWPTVGGDGFGSMSRPGGFRDGELTLMVSDGTAASLLKYRVGELLERLDDRFGKGRVTTVKIQVEKAKNTR